MNFPSQFQKFTFARALVLSLLPAGAIAQETPGVTWGGYVDTYFAYDFSRPRNLDRAYTTQPARHHEMNVNLAFVEVKVDREKTRGRLALQAGTSVQANYAGEPTVGSTSGPSLSRNIQEAYAGYRVADQTWIDAGIFFSHIGAESFISSDNLTYTRSLVADYSPYYQSGARLSHQWSDEWSTQAFVLNGWQNISESNQTVAFGTQVAYAPNSRLKWTYNTFLGRESSRRQFHDLVLTYQPNTAWSMAAQADIGIQQETSNGKSGHWKGATLLARHRVSTLWAVSGRVERYEDGHQVLVTTPNSRAFQVWGASLGVDLEPETGFFFRNEIRGFQADDEIFQTRSGYRRNNAFFVTSVSYRF